MRPLRATLRLIALFQLVLGVGFLAAPGHLADALGLTPRAPAWVHWLLAMLAARFLGYAYGLWWAARQPERAVAWIDTMIAIQVIDWIATVAALAHGDVHLRQVTTASFAPVLFVAALAWFHPRRSVGAAT